MKRKHILAVIALIAVFAFALTGCGKDETPADPEVVDQTWGLSDWNLTATAWSSNNGANVVLTATPNSHYKDVDVSFVARLEGEEVAAAPCEWNDGAYTAALDLNAADGYCYYVVMSSEGGSQVEFEVNTPGNPSNGKLINMEHSLESYCHMTVNASTLEGSKLTITDGAAEIRLPLITHDGNAVACTGAVLILSSGDRELDRTDLPLSDPQAEGVYEPSVNGISFDLPALEDDQQLTLTLEVTLGDGQTLTAPGGTWFYSEGQAAVAVG